MLLVVIVISFLHRMAAIHSPPTDHSIFLLHTLPASTTCASQDPYLSRHLCPGHSVSQTGKLQGQKRAAASSLPVQLGERKKKGKKAGGASQKAAGQRDCTRAEQTFGVAIQRVRSLCPPSRLAGLQPQAQLPQGQTSVQVLWVHVLEVPTARAHA